MAKNLEDFNIVIVGIGGQGLITLLKIINKAAQKENLDLVSSELHGLAQRGGSVEVHIRFGKEIYSPLVKQGGADLIISLESQETLRACYYASKEKAVFLINKFFSPIIGAEKNLSFEEISQNLQKFSKKTIFVDASEICKKEFGTDVISGIYLLGLTSAQKILPLKESSLVEAIKEIVPEKFFELNLKAFNLAKSYQF